MLEPNILHNLIKMMKIFHRFKKTFCVDSDDSDDSDNDDNDDVCSDDADDKCSSPVTFFSHLSKHKEYKRLKELLDGGGLFGYWNTGVTHNDIHFENVMINPETKEMRFIDTEYCSFNYLLYDIANFLNQLEIEYDDNLEDGFAINYDSKLISETIELFESIYGEHCGLQWDYLYVFRALSYLYWYDWALSKSRQSSQSLQGNDINHNFNYKKYAEAMKDRVYVCCKKDVLIHLTDNVRLIENRISNTPNGDLSDYFYNKCRSCDNWFLLAFKIEQKYKTCIQCQHKDDVPVCFVWELWGGSPSDMYDDDSW